MLRSKSTGRAVSTAEQDTLRHGVLVTDWSGGPPDPPHENELKEVDMGWYSAAGVKTHPGPARRRDGTLLNGRPHEVPWDSEFVKYIIDGDKAAKPSLLMRLKHKLQNLGFTIFRKWWGR